MKEFLHKISASLGRFFGNVDYLAILFPLVMIVPNVMLDITENFCFAGKVANIIVPLSIYTLLMSAWKKAGRTILYLIIFMIMNIFQIVVLHLFGESIIAIDMLINCVTTDTSEAGELLSNLIVPITLGTMLYLPLVVWSIWSLCKHLTTGEKFRAKARRYGLIGLTAGILLTSVTMLADKRYNPARHLYPMNVVSNIGSALHRIYQSVNYKENCKDFVYDAVDTHELPEGMKREIHVLFIGETSRSLNWQLFGYERETNPLLSSRDDLMLFTRATSQCNTTHKCVPMMLTSVSPANFEDLNQQKSIITAFKEAGYVTTFISNQPKNHSYTQVMTEEADNLKYLSGNDRYDYNLVDELRHQLADTTITKQFIILHGYGSHFSYKDRYKSADRYFLPDDSSDASRDNRPQLVNAYDNSIRYTDRLLNDIILTLQNDTTSVSSFTFVSDHGEDIYDDERGRLLHASPVPTYYQLRVPMFVWVSPSYDQLYPAIRDGLARNRDKYVAPPQAIFHTLLQMAGIDTPWFDAEQSVASDTYASPRPLYLNDYNEGVPLEESGIKPQDIDNFRRDGIL